MTAEEIKEQYSMRDILSKYGISVNRAGFCSCPFHSGDRTPSMKIYKDSYHCFACGANGDIFTFIMLMYGLSFKEAFKELGGEYEHNFSSKMKVYHARKDREMASKKEQKLQFRKQLNNLLIDVYMKYLNRSEPLSDAWCDCYNAMQMELYHHEILNNPEESYGSTKQIK